MKCTRCGKENPADIHTCSVPDALAWAEQLEQTGIPAWQAEGAAAELRRLHELYEQARDKAVRMIEANDQWAAKTQWVQDTVQPEELGMHRADVLKQRIDRLVNTLAETHSAYQAKLLADEALLRQALGALEAAVSDDLPYIKESKDAIAALRKRLGETK